MSPPPKRHFEVRMLVIAVIDVTSEALTDLLKGRPQPSSVADVVAQEVVSNLESASYVDSAIVSHL